MSTILIMIVGLSILALIAQAVTLFYPLNKQIIGAITVFSILYLLINWSALNSRVKAVYHHNRFILITALPFIIIGLLVGQEPPLHCDTGLYHFQAIKWLAEYPVIKGLANLHGRLGFNSSIFSIHALFGFKDIAGQYIFPLNFCLFVLATFQFLKLSIEAVKNNIFISIANMLLYAGVISMYPNIASPTPDFAANVLLIILLGGLLNTEVITVGDWLAIFIVSVFLITIKLSMAPVLILVIPLLLKIKALKPGTAVLVTFLLSFSIVGIWLIRNVIQSGWLVYPFTGLDLFDVDWKVPADSAGMEADAIVGWARNPGADPQITSQSSFNEWFPVWWSKLSIGKWYFIGCVLSTIYIIYFFIKNKSVTDKKWILISVITGFLFWFFTAPDFRFSIGFIFLLLLMPIFLLAHIRRNPQLTIDYGKRSLLFIYLLVLFMFCYDCGKIINDNIFPSWISGRWKLPKSLDYVGRSEIDSFQLNGHILYFPEKKHEANEDRCYDQCLPCIPFKDTGIGFRGQKIEDGFYRKAFIK